MKRHKSLSLLSSDHHHGLRIAKLLKKAGSYPSLENILNEFTAFFNSELVNHFDKEEKYLAPHLPDHSLILRMFKEHDTMKEMFGNLSRSINLNDDLVSFGNFLEAHIRFEERELFPVIESTLSEYALEDIARRLEHT